VHSATHDLKLNTYRSFTALEWNETGFCFFQLTCGTLRSANQSKLFPTLFGEVLFVCYILNYFMVFSRSLM